MFLLDTISDSHDRGAADAARPRRRGDRINGAARVMARTYLVFGDIEGKLDVLRVECTKCPRKGRYHVAKLIEKYRPQSQHDEMEGAAQRRLPQAGCAPAPRAL